MQLAILIISSASLVCSAGCLCILVAGAKKAIEIQDDVEAVKAKVNHNAKVVKTALGQLEM